MQDLAIILKSKIEQRSPEHADRYMALFVKQNPEWSSVSLPPEDEQIRQLNNFWRVQLGLLQRDTIHTRSFLIDGISSDDWLANFKRYILPIVISTQVPCQS